MTRPRSSALTSARASKLGALLLAALFAVPAGAESVAKPAPVGIAPPQRLELAPLSGRIAVIDVQRILQESLAARSVQKQLETQRAKFQAEISSREKELNDADNELKELRNTSKDGEAVSEKEQQLRQRFMEMERDVQTKRHALDEGFTKSMGVVRDNLLGVVDGLAKAKGLQAVLLKQQALWFEPSLDITDEVLTRLNAKVVDVPVKIDLSGTAATPTPDKIPDKAADKPVQPKP